MNLKKLLLELKQDASLKAYHHTRIIEDWVGYVLKLSWSQLNLSSQREISEEEINQIKQGFNQLFAGEPLAYITNESWFYESLFYVDERVLIPRPETELLVESVLKDLSPQSLVADIGTGSGCMGLSIAKKRRDCQIFLVDASLDALQVCQKNKEQLLIENVQLIHCEIQQQSVVSEIPEESLDWVIANPPYIATGDHRVSHSTHSYEPHQALYAEDNGLFWIKQWLLWSWKHLNKNGKFIFEFGQHQEKDIHPFIDSRLWRHPQLISDYSGNPRFFLLNKLSE